MRNIAESHVPFGWTQTTVDCADNVFFFCLKLHAVGETIFFPIELFDVQYKMTFIQKMLAQQFYNTFRHEYCKNGGRSIRNRKKNSRFGEYISKWPTRSKQPSRLIILRQRVQFYYRNKFYSLTMRKRITDNAFTNLIFVFFFFTLYISPQTVYERRLDFHSYFSVNTRHLLHCVY